MLHLLKIEWLKIKNYRAFWVFCILYFVSIFLVNYIGWTTEQRVNTSITGSNVVADSIYAFPKVWQTVGWMSSWLLYFPGMIMITLMTNEFNFKTHRQNIIDGVSRGQFISVKLLLALLLAVIITLVNVATAYVFGTMSGKAFSTAGTEMIGYIFLQSVAYIFFALMLAVLFRKSGLAIIIFFIYGLIFEWIIASLFIFKFKSMVGYLLPLQASDVLIPMPFAEGMVYPNTPQLSILIATIAAYILVYIFFARKKFVSDDL